jgi:hypothetical protein
MNDTAFNEFEADPFPPEIAERLQPLSVDTRGLHPGPHRRGGGSKSALRLGGPPRIVNRGRKDYWNQPSRSMIALTLPAPLYTSTSPS